MSSTAEKEAPKKASQLTLFEGQKVTDHAVKFSGSVALDDALIVGELTMKNNEVAVVVRGRVVGRSFKKEIDKLGNVTGTVSTSVVLIEDVELLDE